MGLINDLKKCWKLRQSTRNVLKIYGVQMEADIKRPLCTMTNDQVLAQILNWIVWSMDYEENMTIRISETKEQTIYVVELINVHRKGITVQNMKSVPELFDKMLYHWNSTITYKDLSVKEIKISIECADTLNSFNDDVLEQNIDELVNNVIRFDLPNGCKCDCCTFELNTE